MKREKYFYFIHDEGVARVNKAAYRADKQRELNKLDAAAAESLPVGADFE